MPNRECSPILLLQTLFSNAGCKDMLVAILIHHITALCATVSLPNTPQTPTRHSISALLCPSLTSHSRSLVPNRRRLPEYLFPYAHIPQESQAAQATISSFSKGPPATTIIMPLMDGRFFPRVSAELLESQTLGGWHEQRIDEKKEEKKEAFEKRSRNTKLPSEGRNGTSRNLKWTVHRARSVHTSGLLVLLFVIVLIHRVA